MDAARGFDAQVPRDVSAVDVPLAGADAMPIVCPERPNGDLVISYQQLCTVDGLLDAPPDFDTTDCPAWCPYEYLVDPQRDVALWCGRRVLDARTCLELERALDACATCAAE